MEYVNKKTQSSAKKIRNDIEVISSSSEKSPDCDIRFPCSKYWWESPIEYPVESICVRPAS